ncbi:MAG: DMT family transporter [Bacilli bacterium]|nr:DMT family transporter [Bacilli bacterium]
MKYKILVVLGVFLVSFAGIFVQLTDASPSVAAMYRLGLCGLLLLPVSLCHKDIKLIKKQDFRLMALAGLMISLHYFSWFTSLRFTSVTSSTLIICLEPLVALVFGFVLYREKIARSQFILLLVALVGVMIVAWGDIFLSVDALIGDAITFLAVIFMVIYLFIGQNVVKRYSFIVYSSILFIFAGIYLFIYNLITHQNLIDYTPKDWLFIILLVTIPNAGQIIFNYALKYVKPSLIATAILLEPVFATIMAVIVLKDKIFFNQIIGGLIIIISVYIYLRREKVKA